jgi:hypothetical protein
MYNNPPSQEPVSRLEYNRLQEKVGMLEAQIQRMNELLVNKDLEVEVLSRRLPNTWLLDPSYWKRAFTAYAYVTVVGMIIGIPLSCIMFILAVLLGVPTQ